MEAHAGRKPLGVCLDPFMNHIGAGTGEDIPWHALRTGLLGVQTVCRHIICPDFEARGQARAWCRPTSAWWRSW